MIRFEVCVDSTEGAAAAAQGGAHRVELCSGLVEGGTTPSRGLIERTIEQGGLDVVVLVRPRAGDFCYSGEEFEVMKRDVAHVREAGAAGVATGVLDPDGTIDEERTRCLVEAARPLPVTFHRAFDLTRDPFEALDTLLGLGIERVLTSGRQRRVEEGLDLVKQLVTAAGERLLVMPGGGVRSHNVHRILEVTGAREVHFTAFSPHASPMTYRNPAPRMGADQVPDEYVLHRVDPERVRALIGAAGTPDPPGS